LESNWKFERKTFSLSETQTCIVLYHYCKQASMSKVYGIIYWYVQFILLTVLFHRLILWTNLPAKKFH
jgi:hypothetical protein